jgi:threonylcarbamoyladenosine tRNA methylthiotransferase MtaB
MQHFTESQAGQIRKVLFEGRPKEGLMEGYTDNYIKVITSFNKKLVNQVVDWSL